MNRLIWLVPLLVTNAYGNNIESACKRTSLLYAHYADAGKAGPFAALFTSDAMWQTTTGRYEGRAAIAEQAHTNIGAQPRMRHAVTNQLVFVDSPTRATGSAYFTLYVAPPDEDSLNDQPVMVGTYEDEYVMQGEACLFKRRTSTATLRRPPVD
jgi:hypothetical protein